MEEEQKTAREIWKEAGYGHLIRLCEILKKLAGENGPREMNLNSILDVIFDAIREGFFNWFNYYRGNSSSRTPWDCIKNIIEGKLYEGVFAMMICKHLIIKPTILEPKAKPRRDMMDDGTYGGDIDVKSTKAGSLKHLNDPNNQGVVCYYPADKLNPFRNWIKIEKSLDGRIIEMPMQKITNSNSQQ